jgi:hypothetical protein
MACAAAGSCVAVGSYSTGSNSFLGLVLTEASGSWSAAEAPLPSGALILDQHVDLDSVSCSSSTSCVAVGMYYDTSGNTEGLLLTDSSGSWSAAEAPLPSGAAPSSLQDVDLG